MITNIRKSNNPIRLKGIEGNTVVVDQEGDLIGYGSVYYNSQVTANILSFFNMAKKFKSLVYDNNKKDAFVVTRDDGSQFKFILSKDGLYYYDFNNSIKRKKEMEVRHSMIVNTVEEIKLKFTKREIADADKARQLYVTMGRPSDDIFESMIRRRKIINNLITVVDYRNAQQIYGKDLGCIKGKTTRTKAHSVKIDVNSGPSQSLKVVLSVDIMKFMGIAFFVTVSRDIHFITVSVLQDRKKGTIFQVIKTVMNLYKGKGHTVDMIYCNEFNNPVHMILADN